MDQVLFVDWESILSCSLCKINQNNNKLNTYKYRVSASKAPHEGERGNPVKDLAEDNEADQAALTSSQQKICPFRNSCDSERGSEQQKLPFGEDKLDQISRLINSQFGCCFRNYPNHADNKKNTNCPLNSEMESQHITPKVYYGIQAI